MAAAFAEALKTDDPVLVQISTALGPGVQPFIVNATILRPTGIGAGPDAQLLVSVQLPDGQSEQREVPIEDVLPAPRSRRCRPAARLGDSDGWGEGAARGWSGEATVCACACAFACAFAVCAVAFV